MRLDAIFVAICMVLIAASAGAVTFLVFGLTPIGSAVVGGVMLAALALYNVISTRLSVRSAVGPQLVDLARGNANMARQIAEIGRRLAVVEGRIKIGHERPQPATDPLSVEIGELGTLVKQLADTVSAHETKLALGLPTAPAVSEPPPPPPPAAVDAPETSLTSSPPDTATVGATAEAASVSAPAPAGPSAADELVSIIRTAIDAVRIDLYLQPIVTLPQRKVRFYEAMSRLRTTDNEILSAATFIAQAEMSGLMPKIDNLMIFRCVQVVRRLLLKNREIGVFCNISGSTLTNSTVFPQLLEFLDANRAIAPSLVLEFTQASLRAAGPIENESLAALAERGFRFSIDNVSDLRLEPRELANRGVRFIKVPANLLLNRGGSATTDIHPADMSDLLGRFGIDLVAEKIESEGIVVDLLDYDVKYGQGFLFSPPRPVRAEALQGIADRADVVLGEGPTADSGAAGQAPRNGVADLARETRGIAQIARRI